MASSCYSMFSITQKDTHKFIYIKFQEIHFVYVHISTWVFEHWSLVALY